MEGWTIMRLECLAASRCILKDHAAERCTARLWHVLDEQVLTTCQRPRRTLLLVGHRCLRLILDAYQRVRLPVTAGRVPVEDRLQAVPSGVRAATRHPPVCPGVHHLDIAVLQAFPQRGRGRLHRGQALALCRIALAVGAASELPGLLIDARV